MNEFHFGENLRAVRTIKGFSQDGVALGLKMSQTAYSKLERRATIPDLEKVKKIAEILGVAPEILLEGRRLEDLVPSTQFEESAVRVLRSTNGRVLFWVFFVPFIEAIGEMGYAFGEELDGDDMFCRTTRMIAAIIAVTFAYYFMKRLKSGRA